jgi:hypothetical protein
MVAGDAAVRRAQAVAPRDDSEPSLEFALPSPKATVSVAVCVAFVLVGVFLIAVPDASIPVRALGAFSVLLFGALGLLAGRLLIAGDGNVALTERAVKWTRPVGRAVEVPWEAISRVGLGGQGRGAASLGIAVEDRSAVRGPRWFTALMGFNHRFDGFDLLIPMQFLRLDPDLFVDTVQRMLAEPEERATIIDRGIPTAPTG